MAKLSKDLHQEIPVNEGITDFLKTLLSVFKLPFNIVNKLIEFLRPMVHLFESVNEGFRDTWFYEYLIEPWIDREWGVAIITNLMALLVGALFTIIGIFIYTQIEHSINGLDKGIIQTEIQYEKAHTDYVPMVYSNGKSTWTVITPIFTPDTWYFEVKGIDNDRIETWSTTVYDYAEDIKVGDTIESDNFSFVDTEKED